MVLQEQLFTTRTSDVSHLVGKGRAVACPKDDVIGLGHDNKRRTFHTLFGLPSKLESVQPNALEEMTS